MVDDAPERDQDWLLVHGIDDDGKGVRVIRHRGDGLETGRLQPVEDGKPLTGDLVSLRRRPEFPLLFDVKVEVPSPIAVSKKVERDHEGPARASSDSYRRGWQAIWGTYREDTGDLPQ